MILLNCNKFIHNHNLTFNPILKSKHTQILKKQTVKIQKIMMAALMIKSYNNQFTI